MRCPHCGKHSDLPDDLEAILLSKRLVDPINGHWLWTGAVDGEYGSVHVPGLGKRGVHRLSAALFLGLDLANSDEFACHTCDCKLCFNPDHLRVGGMLDNNQERWEKAGYRHPGSPFLKLDEEQVGRIRAMLRAGVHQADIALEFGITQGYVSAIKRNAAWRIVA